MTSHHVTCHVTAMSHASSSSIKEKEIQKKRNIKSRKIDKRKRKILVLKAFYNIQQDWLISILVNSHYTKQIDVHMRTKQAFATHLIILYLMLYQNLIQLLLFQTLVPKTT